MGGPDDEQQQRQLEEEPQRSTAISNSRRSSRRRTRSMVLAHQEDVDNDDDEEVNEAVTSRRIRRRMKGKSKQVEEEMAGLEVESSNLNKGKGKQKNEEGEAESEYAQDGRYRREEAPSTALATSAEQSPPPRLLPPPVMGNELPSASSAIPSLAEPDRSRTLPPLGPRRRSSSSNPFDLSTDERTRARAQIAQALGMGAAVHLAGGRAIPPDSTRPSMLSALLTDILGIRGGQMAPSEPVTGSRLPGTNPGINGTAPARDSLRSRSTNGGTSVIVQGALISRTLPSRQSGTGDSTANSNPSEGSDAPSMQRSQSQPPMTMGEESSTTLPTEEAGQPPVDGETQVATIEEQAAMLIRLLSIATAATAASLVSQPRHQQNVPQRTNSTRSSQQNATVSSTGTVNRAPHMASNSGIGMPARSASVAASSSSWRHASQTYQSLRERFSAFRSRFRSRRGAQEPEQEQHTQPSTLPAITTAMASSSDSTNANEAQDDSTRSGASTTTREGEGRDRNEQDPSGSLSTLSSMLHDAIREGIQGSERGSRGSERPTGSGVRSAGEEVNNSRTQSVHATLDAVRGGQLSRGEEGSFDRFLFDLMSDLDVAVRGLPRERTSDETDEASADDSTRLRRQRDLQDGQLSFFRLFTFPAASQTEANGQTQQSPGNNGLLPCVVVGVRSLESHQGLQGGLTGTPNTFPTSNDAHSPSFNEDTVMQDETGLESQAATETTTTTDQQESSQPMSRFLLFVSGGHYPPQHPLFHSSTDEASRDLMVLMEFLGAMASMHTKPNTTVTKDQIEKSKLRKIMGGLSEISELVKGNKVMVVK